MGHAVVDAVRENKLSIFLALAGVALITVGKVVFYDNPVQVPCVERTDRPREGQPCNIPQSNMTHCYPGTLRRENSYSPIVCKPTKPNENKGFYMIVAGCLCLFAVIGMKCGCCFTAQ